jgi:type II secretory pathway pseudopilin PulG
MLTFKNSAGRIKFKATRFGFTLVEVMIAAAIGIMIVAGISRTILYAMQSSKFSIQIVDFNTLTTLVSAQALNSNGCNIAFSLQHDSTVQPPPAISTTSSNFFNEISTINFNLNDPTNVQLNSQGSPLYPYKSGKYKPFPLTVKMNPLDPNPTTLIDSRGIAINGAYYQLQMQISDDSCRTAPTAPCLGILNLIMLRPDGLGLGVKTQHVGALYFYVDSSTKLITACGPGNTNYGFGPGFVQYMTSTTSHPAPNDGMDSPPPKHLPDNCHRYQLGGPPAGKTTIFACPQIQSSNSTYSKQGSYLAGLYVAGTGPTTSTFPDTGAPVMGQSLVGYICCTVLKSE